MNTKKTNIETSIIIPNIYCWEDDMSGKLVAAFRWKGEVWGLSYDRVENVARRNMDWKYLKDSLKETLDILVHHGKKAFDSHGNIDAQKVMDEEAIRDKYDKIWQNRVIAFNKVVKFKMITKEEAFKLNLI